MISETISHYRILSKLGEGGMGEVYLAEDIRLGRQVALKFLPASYQYDPDRNSRFLTEARAASALRSPNIAAIFDIGEHDGTSFIVMEYVEGELLSRRAQRGQLPPKEVLEVAAQIADALTEAHALGIIHRDIKSSNLIITERGLVKVLDFGLAKIIRPQREGDSDGPTVPLGQQTSHGLVLGTVSFMSPEQALGRALDHRSDLFSLGVVMYEMLTGRLPFEGESSTEIIDKLLHTEPLAIARFNYTVPTELERIVRKCIEKDRERRYQSARELLTDLRNLQRDLTTGSLSTTEVNYQTQPVRKARARRTIDSLAILPLANAGDDPDTEYLSDGITESIINNLSQLPKLKVMARSTVFRYKGKEIDPQQVGRELNVQAILTGRVFQRGDRLVIKMELVDTGDGSQLWGEQYNRKLSDIFAIEEEISQEISDKLRLKLSGAQKKRLAKRHTQDTLAYQLYLKGRYHWNKRTEEGLKKGIEFFEQAIEVDPNYALAYAGLADSYNILVSYSALHPKEAFPLAKEAATKALEIDNTLAEAHTSLAFVMFGFDWDFQRAEKEFKHAIEMNPGYATAHHWYALYLIAMERASEAFAEINRAEELDPLSLPINTNVGWLFHLTRQYEEAVKQYRKTLEMEPKFVLAQRRLCQTYEQMGLYREAVDEFQKALSVSGEDTETLSARGHFYALTGDREKALEVMQELKEMAKRRYIPAYFMARIYVGLGEKESAFEWLEKAYEERYGYLVYIKVEPIFDSLRSDARFAELVHRVGLSL